MDLTQLLLRLFVKDYRNTEDPAVRTRYGKLAGIVGIVCNVLLSAGKLLAGTLSGAVSITADGLNNLSDAASSLVTLLGFRLAERPADEEHPFGHARMEYLSGLFVSVLILLVGAELARSSFEKILHPEPVAFSALSFAVLGASILVKLWMALFCGGLSRRIGSTALRATAQDSRNDVITTAAVLIGCVLGHVLHWQVDGWIGLLVPHCARMLCGQNNRAVIPVSLLLGSALMIVIDTLARSLSASEIPISILTAIIGAPFFIVLLRRTGGAR